MSDLTMGDGAYLQREVSPALPPPGLTRGPIAWARHHLFSSFWSSVLTILFVLLVLWIIPDLLDFALVRAVWRGDAAICRTNVDGACWPFIADKIEYLRYGSYPIPQRWRVDVTEVIGAILVAWLLWTGAPKRNLAALLFFVAYPVVAFILLRGSVWLPPPAPRTHPWA